MPLAPLTERETRLLIAVTAAEARGESDAGIALVAETILVRAAHPRWWGRSLESVLTRPHQFESWTAQRRYIRSLFQSGDFDAGWSAFARQDPGFQNVRAIVRDLLNGRRAPSGLPLTHFYAHGLIRPPRWAAGLTPAITEGGHSFFTAEQVEEQGVAPLSLETTGAIRIDAPPRWRLKARRARDRYGWLGGFVALAGALFGDRGADAMFWLLERLSAIPPGQFPNPFPDLSSPDASRFFLFLAALTGAAFLLLTLRRLRLVRIRKHSATPSGDRPNHHHDAENPRRDPSGDRPRHAPDRPPARSEPDGDPERRTHPDGHAVWRV